MRNKMSCVIILKNIVSHLSAAHFVNFYRNNKNFLPSLGAGFTFITLLDVEWF